MNRGGLRVLGILAAAVATAGCPAFNWTFEGAGGAGSGASSGAGGSTSTAEVSAASAASTSSGSTSSAEASSSSGMMMPPKRWALRFGDSDYQYSSGVAVDGSGDVILAGSFGSTIDLGGGPFTSAGNEYDVFVAKFDTTGKHIWSRSYGDPNRQLTNSFGVDAAGNIILTGSLSGTVDFGGMPLTSAGQSDVFAVKLDPDGNHLWSKRFGDTSSDDPTGIAIDPSGNTILTGTFGGTIDFGSGPLSGGSAFLAKLKLDGSAAWSKQFGDQNGAISNMRVATDAAGNIAMVGSLFGTVDFGGVPLTAVGNMWEDIFVAKFGPSGKLTWCKRFGDMESQVAQGAAFDASGNLLITGSFTGTVDFGGGTLMSPSNSSIYVLKLDPNGGYQWATTYSPSNGGGGTFINVDKAGHPLVAGFFSGTVTLGGVQITSAGNSDILFFELDPSGNYIYGQRYGGSSYDNPTGVVKDAAGSGLVSGNFTTTIDLGTGPLTSAGKTDVFLAKLVP